MFNPSGVDVGTAILIAALMVSLAMVGAAMLHSRGR